MISSPWTYPYLVKDLLSTITSPVFSEIVVVFSTKGLYHSPRGFASTLHEMYRIRQFKAAFCLETLGGSTVGDLHALVLKTRAAVVEGTYDFLPCPPSVFSRVRDRGTIN